MLELLLAPQEDDDDMAEALRTFHPTEGITVLGHAVAWGYDDSLPPLLAAARCLHQPKACHQYAIISCTAFACCSPPYWHFVCCDMVCCCGCDMSLSLVSPATPTPLNASNLSRVYSCKERSSLTGLLRDRVMIGIRALVEFNSRSHAACAGDTS